MQTVQPSRALGTVGTVGIMGFVGRWRRSLKPTCESTGESILTMPWHGHKLGYPMPSPIFGH